MSKVSESRLVKATPGGTERYHTGSMWSNPTSNAWLPDIWRTIRRRWKLVVFSCFAIAALGVIAFWQWPTRYESKAQLAFSFDATDMMQLDDSSLGSLGSNDEQVKLATQVAILQNKDLVLAVISRLDLARNPDFYKFARPGLNSSNLGPLDQERIFKEFTHRLSVRIFPKTYLVDVSFRSPSPRLAQQILSELLKEYVQRSFEARYMDTQQSADWLQKQINGLRTDVETNERRLVELQKENGLLVMGMGVGQGGGATGGPVDMGTTATMRLGEVIKAHVAGQADRIDKEARYRASLTGDPELLASIVPESKIVVLRRQQATLNAQLSSLASQFGSRYPLVLQTKAQLAEVNDAIQKEVGILQEQLKEQFLAAQRGESLLQGTEEASKAEAFKQLGAAAELVALQEEVDSGRRLYEDLERKLKESSVLAGLKSTQVDIVAKPDLAYKPIEPDPTIFSAVLLFLAPVAAICFARLREKTDHAMSNAYEIEEAVDIPVLASLPHQAPPTRLKIKMKAAPAHSSIYSMITENPKSRLTEAIRSLRSALLLSSTTRPKVILVTSPLPQEGKTSISLGLATVLSQNDAKVLLIEADMRRPTFRRSLQSEKTHGGLAPLLSGNATFEESVYTPPASPYLTVIPAGAVPPHPAELLDSAAMLNLINRGRAEYDFVVIDTPPLLSVADALPVAIAADAVLLVARSRVTRRRALLDSCNMLARAGISLSGIVLNDVTDMDGAGYYYGYYNSYYQEGIGSGDQPLVQ